MPDDRLPFPLGVDSAAVVAQNAWDGGAKAACLKPWQMDNPLPDRTRPGKRRIAR